MLSYLVSTLPTQYSSTVRISIYSTVGRYPIPDTASTLSHFISFRFLTLLLLPLHIRTKKPTHKKTAKQHTPLPPGPQNAPHLFFFYLKKKGTDLSSGNHGKGAVLCHLSHYNSPSPGVIALLHKGQTAPNIWENSKAGRKGKLLLWG